MPSGGLKRARTYYWRVDEFDGAAIHKGNVWSFTTGNFLVVDDFAGNDTGAAVGDETTPSCTEETIVHGGRQSIPVTYDNNKQVSRSIQGSG